MSNLRNILLTDEDQSWGRITDDNSIRHVTARQFPILSRVTIPMFEIATNPTIRIDEVKSRRFYIIDGAQNKAKEMIKKEMELIEELRKSRKVVSAIFEVDLNG